MNLVEKYNINADYFAYDGCHKIYIIETDEDMKAVKRTEYEILPIEKLDAVYNDSCPLRFINNWSLTKTIVAQDDSVLEF